MDYFLNEDDLFDDEAGVEVSYKALIIYSLFIPSVQKLVACSFFAINSLYLNYHLQSHK